MSTLQARSDKPSLTRTPPESLADYAIRTLREDLIEGRLVPGQRLSMELLASEMGISHVPLREAVRYLEAEGHFQRDPRSQVRVAPASAAEAAEIYRLRELLESEAHAIGVPRLTESDIDELRRHFAAMDDAVSRGDVAAFARANRAFHFVPFERIETSWIVRFLNIIWDAAARYQTSLFQREGWESDLQRHHADLLDAMSRRNVVAVNQLMDQHRRVTIEAARSLRTDEEDKTE